MSTCLPKRGIGWSSSVMATQCTAKARFKCTCMFRYWCALYRETISIYNFMPHWTSSAIHFWLYTLRLVFLLFFSLASSSLCSMSFFLYSSKALALTSSAVVAMFTWCAHVVCWLSNFQQKVTWWTCDKKFDLWPSINKLVLKRDRQKFKKSQARFHGLVHLASC